MKNMPLISVIVPAYNVSSSIAMTLDLLQRQTYDNLEIICINDGSTDSTSDIINVLKQKDSRIVLINKENGGVSSARNIGLNNAHGEYVCFFDPGDEADSDFVMYLYKLLLSEKADLAICSYNFKMENGQILDRNRFYEIVDKNTIFNQEEALTEIMVNFVVMYGINCLLGAKLELFALMKTSTIVKIHCLMCNISRIVKKLYLDQKCIMIIYKVTLV